MRKGLDEMIDEGVLQWFCYVERMERDRIAERVYVETVQVVVQWVGHRRDGLIP